MEVPSRREVLPALLNHRSPGVSPGTWESRGMSPTGYPGYPTPLCCCIERGPATAVGRPHRTVRDKPIAARSSEEFPEAGEVLEAPFQSDLSGRIRLERSDLPPDQGRQGCRIRRDRDIRRVGPAIEEAGDVRVLQGEVVRLSVPQLDQDGLRQALQFGP